MFEGRVAQRFADAAPRVADRRVGHGVLGLRRQAPLQGGSQRGRRPADRRTQLRAGSLRRDARRRVRHRRTRARHGPQRCLRVAQLPVVARGLRRPALPTRRQRPRVSRWRSSAPRTTGTSRNGPGTHPGRIIPCQVPWLLDPELGAAEIRRNAARGFRAVTFPELPERLGLPSLHTGYWEPFVAACAETRHGRVSPRGLVVDRADHVVGRAVRHHRRAVLRVGDVRGGRLAVLDAAGALPGPAHLPVRRRDGLGRRPARSARPRRALPADVRHVGRRSTSHPAR